MASKTVLTSWTEIEAFAAVRVSIKGDPEQTAKALEGRGIRAVLVGEGKTGSTFWDVAEGVRPALTAWFCEPTVCGKAGYPVGTLLYHG